ncbi:hypothetical protein [Mesonia aquimarina]|uniref:hypothetical protein n=1 Tax=Mesonia aquimarina TaxID=1504967 RepID=UPI000EF61306|nr:hypothetical protein [Mesonia aquimarina]
MKKFLLVLVIFSAFHIEKINAQDANNPIDPSPTVGLWNRFYSNDQSRLQLLANMSSGKWFYRFSAEYEFNYGDDYPEQYNYDESNRLNENQFNSANFLVARLFQTEDGKHNFGFGAVISYFHETKFAGGVNFVSVSKLGKWKFISLATLQTGKNVFSMEFQPGIYHDFERGWYFRSHPRMLFNFRTGQHEVPLGAGFGKIFNETDTVYNLFFEPQYDVINTKPMLYTGIKVLF